MSSTTISAIYEQGTLYLLEPLTLPESSQVQVWVEENGSRLSNTFQQYLERTQNALARLNKQWSENLVYQTVAKLFQDELLVLDQLCPSGGHRDLCAILILATQRLSDYPLVEEQVEALQFVLDKLALEEVSESDIEESHERTLDSGLYLTFNLEGDALLLDTDA